MYIKENSDYAILRNSDTGGTRLILRAPWREEFNDLVRRFDLCELSVSFAATNDGDISFIRDMPWIRGIFLGHNGFRDLRPLESLPQLTFIMASCKPKYEIDFSKFKDLRGFRGSWSPKFESLLECAGLVELRLDKFGSRSLSELSNLRSLIDFEIQSRILTALDGIEELRSITSVTLANCPKLDSFSAIAHAKDSLMDLRIVNCKNLFDVSFVGQLRRLSRLLIRDCGEIKSLAPLAPLSDLQSLCVAGKTKVLDGNLSVVASLPKLAQLAIGNFSHYSPSRTELLQIIG